nr:helix-turn-helix domain-containing protein [Ensifer adhaerens]
MSVLFKAHLGSTSRKMLAVRLADFADDDGKGIWPTVARLSRETELSERQVQRILAEFVDEGLLVVKSRGGSKPGEATRYDFSMSAIARLKDPKAKSEGCHGVTHDTESPTTPAAAMGDTDDADGCHHVTQTVIEPPVEPSDLREGAREGFSEECQTETSGSIERSFRRWMPSWPTYVGDSVDAARSAWVALSPEERVAAEARTADYLDAAKVGGRKTICSMAVYLREKRWEKLPAKPAAAQGPKLAGPFGKLWMATRLADLFRKPYGTGIELNQFERRLADKIQQLITSGAEVPADLTKMELSMLADGNPVGYLMRDKVLRHGWPLVNEMQARASEAKGYPCPQDLMPYAEAFQQVPREGELFSAWKAEHSRRGWPFFSEGRLPEWIWFPPLITMDGGGLDVSAALDHFHHQISDYLAARGRGHDNAA